MLINVGDRHHFKKNHDRNMLNKTSDYIMSVCSLVIQWLNVGLMPKGMWIWISPREALHCILYNHIICNTIHGVPYMVSRANLKFENIQLNYILNLLKKNLFKNIVYMYIVHMWILKSYYYNFFNSINILLINENSKIHMWTMYMYIAHVLRLANSASPSSLGVHLLFRFPILNSL